MGHMGSSVVHRSTLGVVNRWGVMSGGRCVLWVVGVVILHHVHRETSWMSLMMVGVAWANDIHREPSWLVVGVADTSMVHWSVSSMAGAMLSIVMMAH